MKNRFKFILAAAAVLVAAGASAQEDPQKETVIVAPFTYSSCASAVVRDNVRSAVMSGFSNVGRFYVVDALTDSRLSKLYENHEAEDAVTDENWKSESEAAYKAVGAKKLVEGRVELPYEHKMPNDEGKMMYYTDINFTLRVFDIATGTMDGLECYKYSGLSYESYADSFNEAIKKITKDMIGFCNEFFKFEFKTCILELGEADKKGVIKELWIAGGTEMGIDNGTNFKVIFEKKVGLGPKVAHFCVGKVIAKEVLDGKTRCEIMDKKDGKYIKEKFDADEKLTVIVDRKKRIILSDPFIL